MNNPMAKKDRRFIQSNTLLKKERLQHIYANIQKMRLNALQLVII